MWGLSQDLFYYFTKNLNDYTIRGNSMVRAFVVFVVPFHRQNKHGMFPGMSLSQWTRCEGGHMTCCIVSPTAQMITQYQITPHFWNSWKCEEILRNWNRALVKVPCPILLSTTLNKMTIPKFRLYLFFVNRWDGGGLLPSNHFWLLKMPFQFPIEWIFFDVSTTANGHLKISI